MIFWKMKISRKNLTTVFCDTIEKAFKNVENPNFGIVQELERPIFRFLDLPGNGKNIL